MSIDDRPVSSIITFRTAEDLNMGMMHLIIALWGSLLIFRYESRSECVFWNWEVFFWFQQRSMCVSKAEGFMISPTSS